MFKKLLIFLSIMFYTHLSFAQIFPGENIDVIVNGDTLLNPWMGGLDSPQFSGADIDRDGKEDLLIFDKKANKVLVFLKQDDGSYKHTPDLEHIFPLLRDFALFRDYNCDGLVDIFAQASGGIIVYRQTLTAGEISFEVADSILMFEFNGAPLNLYNVNGDVPAIIDIDGDGDLDIITFPFTVFQQKPTLFKNLSQENGYGCDSMYFEEFNMCWGYVVEGDSNEIDFDISCKGGPSNTPILSSGAKHIGSSFLVFDPNEDGKMDLLLGDVGFNSLTYLQNKNTNLDAHMDVNLVDYAYPSYDVSIDVDIFPAAFYVDVTNDGKKDLLVSPNSTDEICVNTTGSWLYENTGNTSEPFRFVQNNFLIDGTIDLGSFSHPTFFDHNGDGLLDLIVSNGYHFSSSGVQTNNLYYYENVGTDTLPIFELKNEDYLGLSTFPLNYLRPTFGDLDGDGDEDLIIGDREGNLNYYENTAGAGNEANFVETELQYFNLDVGDFAHPQLIDVNKDGLLDLVVGRAASYGEIVYYWNFGTTSVPLFHVDSVNNAFGNIKTTFTPNNLHGYSSPFILQTDTQDYLYTGSDLGYVAKYLIDEDSLRNGTFYMESPNLVESKVGLRSTISIVDINNDGALEYFLGNSRGGVSFYADTPPTDTTTIVTSNVGIKDLNDLLKFNLFPNPTNNLIFVELENQITNYQIEIINTLGQTVFLENRNKPKTSINVSGLNNGVYYIKLKNEKGEIYVKSFLKN